MRRVVSAVIAGALALGLMAGCGGSSKSSGGIQSSDPVIKKIQERGVLNAGVKVDVPKFGFRDTKTEKIDGFEVDLVRAIAKEILGKDDDKSIHLEGVNATTRGAMLDDGSLDVVVATFTIKEDRKLKWNFTDPYFTDNVGFLVRKDSGIKSMADLNGKKIGVAKSSSTKDALTAEGQKKGYTFEFLDFGTYPEIKQALDAKRIDAFSVDRSILFGYLDKNTELLPDKFAPQDYGVATKKENTELAKVVNDVINRMKKDGSIDKLLAKWELK
jgi:putative glutamine transport system substrate-binding protein